MITNFFVDFKFQMKQWIFIQRKKQTLHPNIETFSKGEENSKIIIGGRNYYPKENEKNKTRKSKAFEKLRIKSKNMNKSNILLIFIFLIIPMFFSYEISISFVEIPTRTFFNIYYYQYISSPNYIYLNGYQIGNNPNSNNYYITNSYIRVISSQLYNTIKLVFNNPI